MNTLSLRGNSGQVDRWLAGNVASNVTTTATTTTTTSVDQERYDFMLLVTAIVAVVCFAYAICTLHSLRRSGRSRARATEDSAAGAGATNEEGTVLRIFNLSGDQRRAVLEAIFSDVSKPVTEADVSKKRKKKKKIMTMEAATDNEDEDNQYDQHVPHDVEIPAISTTDTDGSMEAHHPCSFDDVDISDHLPSLSELPQDVYDLDDTQEPDDDSKDVVIVFVPDEEGKADNNDLNSNTNNPSIPLDGSDNQQVAVENESTISDDENSQGSLRSGDPNVGEDASPLTPYGVMTPTAQGTPLPQPKGTPSPTAALKTALARTPVATISVDDNQNDSTPRASASRPFTGEHCGLNARPQPFGYEQHELQMPDYVMDGHTYEIGEDEDRKMPARPISQSLIMPDLIPSSIPEDGPLKLEDASDALSALTSVAPNALKLSHRTAATLEPEGDESKEEQQSVTFASVDGVDHGSRAGLGRPIPLARRESFTTVASEYTYEDDSTVENDCSICLGGYKQGDMLIASKHCTHVFHKECILEWLEKHDECPVCRKSMMTDSEMNHAVTSVVGSNRQYRTSRPANHNGLSPSLSHSLYRFPVYNQHPAFHRSMAAPRSPNR